VLRVPLSNDAVVQKLEEAAKRGRLAGFERGTGDVLFTTSAFSAPFDGELEAHAVNNGEGIQLRFSTRMKRKLLWVFVVVLILSIWPGLPITESLLASMFPFWPWLWKSTIWWYLPLSIIGSPWAVWSAVKKSQAGITVSAVEMVGKIQKELGAQQV
jgi:hypothetical protein